MKKLILPFLVLGLAATSCKKKQEEPEKVGGCTDKDSPYYNSDLDFDDGSCKYAYVTEVKVINFPEKNNGSSWDAIINTKADIYFKIKPYVEMNYDNYFSSEGNEISNAIHNDTNSWTSGTQFKLTNADWYYELADDDNTSPDDIIASGTFNPLSSISTSSGICSINHPNGTQIRLVLTFQ